MNVPECLDTGSPKSFAQSKEFATTKSQRLPNHEEMKAIFMGGKPYDSELNEQEKWVAI